MDVRRLTDQVRGLASDGLDWVSFATAVDDALRRVIPFDGSCWHSVDPGTVLLTGSVNRNVGCSGFWLAEHEFVIEDVNKWAFLAQSGRFAGATSIATHGDLMRSARNRSHSEYGIGDELRGSFVVDGNYWAAAGFLREADRPWYTEDEVRLLASLSRHIAAGARRALVSATVADLVPSNDGPGVIVFDEHGQAESLTPAASHWIDQLVEHPPPPTPAESRIVQAVAARARAGGDPLRLAARTRAQTHTGGWLLLYGSVLSGSPPGRTVVVIQPAPAGEVAPLVALAYGLSVRECAVTRLCIEGRSTKEMAQQLSVSAYTVQDHLKSIFDKTGVRSRGELVGQVFLQHYLPRWDDLEDAPAGWHGYYARGHGG
ncbi:helix-turn-helix transcriptional regulator [Lentzea sp. NBRC 105346]|uniref:helix-turn-helix domain-containing protein n=1 Tax=Lentzea sp. NBRC 105346 TaxID=3032205 RepID=UPI0024A461CA|nr:helix-turn-helix transcriptional regulator [Lentzea sp. NBRC 105346]GLZ28754.1 helix-turn-helix transcriptional regulator [Lentzea sp. NBRC 105346]